MIPTLIVSIVGGFFTHRINDLFDAIPHVFSGGWREITGHIVGVLATYPFLEMIYVAFGIPREFFNKLRSAYLMAFTFFGIGVALGWLYDAIQHNERH